MSTPAINFLDNDRMTVQNWESCFTAIMYETATRRHHSIQRVELAKPRCPILFVPYALKPSISVSLKGNVWIIEFALRTTAGILDVILLEVITLKVMILLEVIR